jgi:tRNA(adenine34) deaminase
VLLCLHPIPGWSYLFHPHIATWLQAGSRVIAPDLIGFGKSDKPKRQDFHSVNLHVQSLLQLLDRLGVDRVSLLLAGTNHALAGPFMVAAGQRVTNQIHVWLPDATLGLQTRVALDAPHPDNGHRAGERAFASKDFR